MRFDSSTSPIMGLVGTIHDAVFTRYEAAEAALAGKLELR